MAIKNVPILDTTKSGAGYDAVFDVPQTGDSYGLPKDVSITGDLAITGTVDGVNIGDNYANWNTAFGWGNHASVGYLTAQGNLTGHITSTGLATILGSFTLAQLNTALSDAILGETIIVAVALGDETTPITTGIAKVTFHMPNFATTLTEVALGLTTAGTGSTITADLNEAGVSVLSTKITVDATEQHSSTAATPPVISDSALAANALMSVDFDAVDSGGVGAGPKIYLTVKRA